MQRKRETERRGEKQLRLKNKQLISLMCSLIYFIILLERWVVSQDEARKHVRASEEEGRV